MSKITLKFDANQEHQLKAIDSAVRLFDGLPAVETGFQMGDEIVANAGEMDFIDEDFLNDNLDMVQSANGIKKTSLSPQWDDGLMLEGVSDESWRYPQFTVEMETGTGKTYVYLRTIHELRRRYGLRKFVIIVPSIAIYEGVIKSFDITKSHFDSLYGGENVHLTRYAGDQLSKLRGFATSSFTEIMVMTIDAFNKATNNIFKPTEKLPGEMLPYQYIQKTRPVLILDESQNYRSDKSRQALRTLKPLFSINYSATPIDKPNMIYCLTPVDAFKMNLVKKIEVLGVVEQFNYNQPQMRLALYDIKLTAYGLAALLHVHVHRKGEIVEEIVSFRKGDDLYEKTGNENYRGIVIAEIDKANNVVTFTNEERLSLHDEGPLNLAKEEIFRVQIDNTIKYHFARQRELLGRGIKVLSLFFIDRVANFVYEDGLIKRLFDEAYDKHKRSHPYFRGWSAEEVREGYFAKKRTKNLPDEFVDTTIEEEKKTAADKSLEKAAYELIMKDKERLLSFDEKVCFIFAHSALKEGWDNPNVFQICTLNQTKSETKKRQEIGRGLRLAVDQNGERVTDDQVNILTVIANESYESYVSGLQNEYQEAGDATPPPPSNAHKAFAARNDRVFNGEDFRRFWGRLCQRTDYQINVDTEKLIELCTHKLNRTPFPEPQIVITKGEFVMVDYRLRLLEVKARMCKLEIIITDTNNNVQQQQTWFHPGKDLSRHLNDPNLKGFRITGIVQQGDESKVIFSDRGELALGEMVRFQKKSGLKTDPIAQHEAQTTYPVFNIIDRAMRETQLTRRTILHIFKGLDERIKRSVFKNPEGFTSIFIKTIRDVLANHVADRIQYTLKDGLEAYEIEAIFPELQKFPQKELLDGSAASLYDQVQVDSDVERRFVTNRLNAETDKMICYFKFPFKFRINMPKVIGNYNPDWGIIRWDEDGAIKLELVRETKGSIDPNLLQYQHEKRKIQCAEAFFAAIGVDYRQITDEVAEWWKKKSDNIKLF
ncbi:DEAD/DEAH box helicase family protein [candidate division KSB1 bacterium]|nr:DEAD/DEAH box helicase family protein [candidate division KSB1 bacterium]